MYMYVCVYIYVCVCICVCMFNVLFLEIEQSSYLQRKINSYALEYYIYEYDSHLTAAVTFAAVLFRVFHTSPIVINKFSYFVNPKKNMCIYIYTYTHTHLSSLSILLLMGTEVASVSWLLPVILQ